MFAKKLVLIAAAVALAMTTVAAEEQASHIKIHVGKIANHHKQVNETAPIVISSADGSAVIDIDLEDDDSTSDASASEDGSDEDNTDGSDEDSTDGSDEDSTDGSDEDSTDGSVDSADGSDADVGDDSTDGSEAEEGIEITLDFVDSDDSTDGSEDSSVDDVCVGKDGSPLSVEGVEGVFCVTGQACAADVEGACPEKQEGLPFGAYCGTVKSGVLGCKPNTEESLKKRVKHAHKKTVVAKKPVVAKKTQHKKPVAAKKTVTVKKVAHKKATPAKHAKPSVKKVEHKHGSVKVTKTAAKTTEHKKKTHHNQH